MQREIVIQCPDGQIKTVPLQGDRFTVGRSSAAELYFPDDAGLSRQHMILERDGDDWTVQDLGSKNGTLVNNIPLRAKLRLKPGDRITAGHLAIVFDEKGAGAQRGVVMTLEGDRLEVKANKGEGFRISSAVRDRVINEKASVLVRDAQLDEADRKRMSIVEQKVRTLMAVPLQTEKRTIGLIYVDSPNMFRAFTKDDLSLLTVMANVAAIRIEHAR